MRNGVSFLCLCTALLACSPDVAPVLNEQAATPRPAPLLTGARREVSTLTREWLVGYWALDGDCAFPLDTGLWPDGSYTMGEGGGRWTLSGDTLTIIQHRPPGIEFMRLRLGDPGRSRVRMASPDRILVDWEGAPSSTAFTLCP